MSINCFAEGSGSCRIESIPGAYVYANVSQVGGTDWLAFTVNAYGVEDGMVTVTVKYDVPYQGKTYSYEIVKTIEFKDGKGSLPKVRVEVPTNYNNIWNIRITNVTVENPICR